MSKNKLKRFFKLEGYSDDNVKEETKNKKQTNHSDDNINEVIKNEKQIDQFLLDHMYIKEVYDLIHKGDLNPI